SLSPTRASGGSVKMQYGISRSRVLRVSPARLSLMILKSSAGTWGNCGLPAHSPTAPTLGALVSIPLFTPMYAPASQSTTGFFKSNPGGVRNAPRRDQHVTTFDFSFTGPRTHEKTDILSRLAVYMQCLG